MFHLFIDKKSYIEIVYRHHARFKTLKNHRDYTHIGSFETYASAVARQTSLWAKYAEDREFEQYAGTWERAARWLHAKKELEYGTQKEDE